MTVSSSPLRRTCTSPARPSALEACSSRRRWSPVAHSRPLAPVSNGSLPCRLAASTRWLVNEIRAVTPSTAGAASASCTACASGLGGGVGPDPPAARAIAAALPARTTTVVANRASRRRVEIWRRYDIRASGLYSVGRRLGVLSERSLTDRDRLQEAIRRARRDRLGLRAGP